VPLAPARSGQQSAAQPAARDAVLQTQDNGGTVYGRTADGKAVLIDPKNVAVAPDSKVYVVEGRGARVTVFNADGSFAATWGGPGQGDGQFQEPWGITVGDRRGAGRERLRRRYLEPSGAVLRPVWQVPG
jgi:hypothetical protein